MNIFGLLIILACNTSISDIRTVYKSQDEDKVLAMLQVLEKKTSLTIDEQCYKAVFICMKADYLTWPNEKLAAFKKGYKELNSIIAKHPTKAEYRYHRYMIEKFTPSWLIDVNHMESDKTYVETNLAANHPMYSFITSTINQ
jgi:hypothetical protein|tara:strand:- start:228 stop:653 length:426 start_codon:yes stop_codon:yes gene_type:complete